MKVVLRGHQAEYISELQKQAGGMLIEGGGFLIPGGPELIPDTMEQTNVVTFFSRILFQAYPLKIYECAN